MKTKNPIVKWLTLLACILVGAQTSRLGAQTNAFTYQGQLTTNGVALSGSYDLRFVLYDAASGGSQQGIVTNLAVAVSSGLFTTTLDFGSAVFAGGADRWLEIAWRTNGGGTFGVLAPRQQITSTPYAIVAKSANNLLGSVPANQLTGTLPAGLLSGGYGNAVALTNPVNSYAGNGGGLTSLNASQLTSGTVADARLSTNVALLNAVQTFSGSNTFAGNAGSFVINNNASPINTSLFTGLGLQYYIPSGEGAIMSSYNDGFGFLSFYTKQGPGFPIVKQMIIDKSGGVAIDQQGANNGLINNGVTNGVGLTFGVASGEGIASKRTLGGNQFGLDFYTSFSNRMSISSNGFVGIGKTAPTARLDIGGVAGTDGIRFPDGTLQTTAPTTPGYSFSSGNGLDPATTNNFIGPTTAVTISSSSQRVLVTANKALGSTTNGATGLNLYIGYRVAGSGAVPTTVGVGSFGMSVTPGTRVLMGLSGIITGLSPGTYDVGLMGSSPNAIYWNYNEYGYVTALIF